MVAEGILLVRDYFLFVRHGWPLLLFGLVTVFMGNFGQSFFISWYGAEIQRSLGLNAGTYGTTYSIATLMSGTTIMFIGGWIDRMSLLAFSSLISAGLFFACWLFFFTDSVWMLLAAFFMVRLCGQGLMPHTGFTTMARCFSEHRGKALSIAASGVPLGEIVLPGLAVILIGMVGWRHSWALVATLIPFFYLPVVLMLLRQSTDKGFDIDAHVPVKKKKNGRSGRSQLLRDSRFWCALPTITAAPFVVTGIFIHQGFILQEKLWSSHWFAVCFVIYGVVHWSSSIGAGVLVDRFSATRLLPFYILPIAAALVVAAVVTSHWGAAAMLALLGISIGSGGPIVGALWAEIYGTDQLGAIRSTATSFIVWSTSLSPILFGFLIDHGISVQMLFVSTAIGVVAASLLARYSYKNNQVTG